jgi:hypothetical protein
MDYKTKFVATCMIKDFIKSKTLFNQTLFFRLIQKNNSENYILKENSTMEKESLEWNREDENRTARLSRYKILTSTQNSPSQEEYDNLDSDLMSKNKIKLMLICQIFDKMQRNTLSTGLA